MSPLSPEISPMTSKTIETELAEAMERLQVLENACEQLAAERSLPTYEAMLADGSTDTLIALDNARRGARDFLRNTRATLSRAPGAGREDAREYLTGCDANNGGPHAVETLGRYHSCRACGETITNPTLTEKLRLAEARARKAEKELAALSPPSTGGEGEAPCWRCNGEGCIQEGSPEAWNYADCPECGGPDQ